MSRNTSKYIIVNATALDRSRVNYILRKNLVSRVQERLTINRGMNGEKVIIWSQI